MKYEEPNMQVIEIPFADVVTLSNGGFGDNAGQGGPWE